MTHVEFMRDRAAELQRKRFRELALQMIEGVDVAFRFMNHETSLANDWDWGFDAQ